MLGDVDYNGWSPDSPFVFDNTAWTSSLSFPTDYKTFWTPRDVTLHASSNAVDAGLVIPNISDGLMGSAPDLGAWERGAPILTYGARSDTLAPVAPTSITLQ